MVLEDVLDELGLTIFGRGAGGREIVCACPFCGEKKRHLHVNAVSHKWHCFKCNEAGRSLKSLAEKIGVKLPAGAPRRGTIRTTKEDEPPGPSTEVQAVLEAVVDLAHARMSNPTRRYLLGRLRDETVEKFHLGEAYEGLAHDLIHERGFPVEAVVSAGVAEAAAKSADGARTKWPRSVVIPVADKDGRIANLLYRLPDDIAKRRGGDRYRSLPNLPRGLFNPRAAEGTDTIFVTEGPFDAMTLDGIGLPAVGLPSATTIKPEFGPALAGKRDVYVVMDNDDPGEMARKRLREVFPSVRFIDVRLPKEVKDVNDFVTKSGGTKEHLDELVAGAKAASSRGVEEHFLPEPRRLCPAQDFVDGHAYQAVRMREPRTAKDGGSYTARPKFVLRSDGELLRVVDPARYRDPDAEWAIEDSKLVLDRPLQLVADRWCYRDRRFDVQWFRKRARTGTLWPVRPPAEPWIRPVRVPRVIFDRVLIRWRTRVFFPDRRAHVISALYVFLSYFVSAFDAVPYLHLHGVKGSGKTTAGKLFEALGFNAVLWSSASAASIFRTLDQTSGMGILDEFERFRSREASAEQPEESILRSGYKRGGIVTRTELRGKTWVPVDYKVFGPKVILNISGLDDVLEDRAITLRTQVGLPEPGPAPHLPGAADDDLAELRDCLHCLSMRFYAEIPPIRDRVYAAGIPGLNGRPFELFAPLVTIAEWLEPGGRGGLRRIVESYARDQVAERRKRRETPEDRVIEALLDHLDERGLSQAAVEMAEIHRLVNATDADPMAESEVGQVLKRIGVPAPERRKVVRDGKAAKIRSYRIDRSALAARAPWLGDRSLGRMEEAEVGTRGDRPGTGATEPAIAELTGIARGGTEGPEGPASPGRASTNEEADDGATASASTAAEADARSPGAVVAESPSGTGRTPGTDSGADRGPTAPPGPPTRPTRRDPGSMRPSSGANGNQDTREGGSDVRRRTEEASPRSRSTGGR